MSSRARRGRGPCRGEVAGQADHAQHDHADALDVGRVGEAPDRRDHDRDRDRDQREAVGERREHLGALEAERPPRAGGPRRHRGREQPQRDRADVGEHVAGVGEQRERAGDDPADGLATSRTPLIASATTSAAASPRAGVEGDVRMRHRARGYAARAELTLGQRVCAPCRRWLGSTRAVGRLRPAAGGRCSERVRRGAVGRRRRVGRRLEVLGQALPVLGAPASAR